MFKLSLQIILIVAEDILNILFMSWLISNKE